MYQFIRINLTTRIMGSSSNSVTLVYWCPYFPFAVITLPFTFAAVKKVIYNHFIHRQYLNYCFT